MYRYQKFIHLFIFVIILFLAFNNNYNPFTLHDVEMVSQSFNDASKTEDTLYKEIQKKSPSYADCPQNAYIDRVWKKTPGRNGIKVNIGKSYNNMKKDGKFDESLLIFEKNAPEISLKDLPPSPIYRGHPDKKTVAFLINVSWGTEHIPDILSILKQHKVKATFFIEGKWAKENPSVVKMIDEEDHLIGNHAYSHPNMAQLSKEANMEQIKQTNDIIKAIVGKTPLLFAPPSGSFTDEVVNAAHQLQMETILWTVDTIDWRNPSVSVMMNRVFNNIHPGAMILMHPTSAVVKGLEPMIIELKNLDYRLGTVDRLLSEER